MDMPASEYLKLCKAMTYIEAEKGLQEITYSFYPDLTKKEKTRLYKSLQKTMEGVVEKEKKIISSEDAAKEIQRFLGG